MAEQITIREVQDSFLLGKSRAERWRQEFEDKFYGPLGIQMIQMMIGHLSEAELVDLRNMNPELFDKVIKVVTESEA